MTCISTMILSRGCTLFCSNFLLNALCAMESSPLPLEEETFNYIWLETPEWESARLWYHICYDYTHDIYCLFWPNKLASQIYLDKLDRFVPWTMSCELVLDSRLSSPILMWDWPKMSCPSLLHKFVNIEVYQSSYVIRPHCPIPLSWTSHINLIKNKLKSSAAP